MTTLALPPGLTTRAPTMEDLGAVLDLVIACDIAEFGAPDYTEEDLRGDWGGLDLATDAWLVVAPGGRIVGYATTHHREHVKIDASASVHPGHVGRGIGTHLVRLTEARAREHIPLAPPEARVAVSNTVNSANEAAGRILAAAGYVPVRHFSRMEIELREAPPAPDWPEGVTVRRFVPGRDERAVHATVVESFRDMWGYIPPTFEEWKAFMIERADFDPALWFIAEAGDEIAGVALCPNYADTGWVRSLGVRRPGRRRGLGLALLRAAFAEFYARGQRTVGLGVDTQSLTGATRLYERAGMRATRRFDSYEKELRPGRELGTQGLAG